MNSMLMVEIFFAACGAGILLACVLPGPRHGMVMSWMGGFAGVTAMLAGAIGLLSGKVFACALWSLPELGTLTLKLDPLSAVFVVVTGLVLLPASIYAGSELQAGSVGGRERPFTVMVFALYASILLILLAGDALMFLLAWEIMSILCYLLVLAGAPDDAARASSSFLLLAMGEAGTVACALGFLLLAQAAGSLDFGALRLTASGLGDHMRWGVFLLTFFGFGIKAGLVPVNSWLQRAYAAAPRPFAPVFAGATLNLGLYGIVRVNADLLPAVHPGTGLVMLVAGTASALIGILYATTDNDLKSMLAHSSIENVGIVVAGFGAGAVFFAAGHPVASAIAFVAALYHLVNHSLYKTLLFIGVGSVESRTGTRDMDRLGGLIRWMPLTAAVFLVGSLSIAGMPPFNGFVSEWLTLQAMLRSSLLSATGVKIVFALCGAGLALTAALAVTCFVKVFAMSFLGMRRLEENRNVSDPARGALAAMGILAALCLLLGVLPTYVVPALDPATMQLTGASAANALVPPFFGASAGHATLPAAFVADFYELGAQLGQGLLPGRGLVVLHRGGAANPVVFAMSTGYMLATLGVLLGLTWLLRRWLSRGRRVQRRARWDGGVRRLLPEMTYTATGFSNPVRVIFDAVFRPRTVENTSDTVAEHFRNAIRREKERVHLVDRLVFRPVRAMTLFVARILAIMHHGRINAYVTYAFLTLLIAFALLPMS